MRGLASNNLYGKISSPFGPQHRGSAHSIEGQNRGLGGFSRERRSYKKIPCIEFEDLY